MNLHFQVYRQLITPWISAILSALCALALIDIFLLQKAFDSSASFLLVSVFSFSLLFAISLLLVLQGFIAPLSDSTFSLVKASATSKPDAEKPAGEAAAFTTLTIINNHKTELLRFSEIIWLQSDNNGVAIQTISKKYVLYRSLRSIEQELDIQQFVRIHRSAIVNRLFIESIHQLPGGDGYVTLTTGEEIRYSRSYKYKLIGE